MRRTNKLFVDIIANAIVTTLQRRKSGGVTATPKAIVRAVLVRSSGNSAFRIAEFVDRTIAFRNQGSFKLHTTIGQLKRKRGVSSVEPLVNIRMQNAEARGSTDHRPVNLRERAAPGQRHGHLELVAENFYDPAHAGRAPAAKPKR